MSLPTVTLVAAAVNEGDTKSYSYTVVDPGVDTFRPADRLPDLWLERHTISKEAFDSASGGSSFDCTFRMATPTSDVAIQLEDLGRKRTATWTADCDHRQCRLDGNTGWPDPPMRATPRATATPPTIRATIPSAC